MMNIYAKSEVSSLNSPRYAGGPKIVKVGHVTPPRLYLTYFWIFIVSALHDEYSCQIWSF